MRRFPLLMATLVFMFACAQIAPLKSYSGLIWSPNYGESC